MDPLPPEFTNRIRATFGGEGEAWLGRLPAILDSCAARWSLQLGAPFEPLSYNYVAPATGPGGKPVVLKLGVPNPELETERAALQHFAGRGAVRLLDAEPGLGALLLERLLPGRHLTTLENDDQATRIAAGVMVRLWRPPPAAHSFPSVALWARAMARLRERFSNGTGPLPPALVATAEALYDDLLSSMAPPVVLHGDLHHENILSAGRESWLALDPKGVIGEPAYEVGSLLRNPLPQLLQEPDPGRVLARRAEILADVLGFDRNRLVGWGLAQAVLSACWSIEDEGRGWEGAIACAAHLAWML